jgi:RNA polymerase sigma-70 factor (ECF subfamily)
VDELVNHEGDARRGVAGAPAALLQEELQAALDALPEEFRLAVVLSDVEEMSYKEIADILGCPIGTVMSRLHRGRKLLKSTLHEHAVALGIVDEAADAEPTNLDEYRAKRRLAAR